MTELKKNTRISLAPEYIEMLDKVGENRGGLGRPETLRNLIFVAYSRMNGVEEIKIKEQTGSPLPKKVKLYQQTKADKLEEDARQKASICDILDGENVNGICKYYKYDGKDRFLQEVLVHDLNKSNIDEQYMPSRVIVEDIQKMGNATYDLDVE